MAACPESDVARTFRVRSAELNWVAKWQSGFAFGWKCNEKDFYHEDLLLAGEFSALLRVVKVALGSGGKLWAALALITSHSGSTTGAPEMITKHRRDFA